MTQDKATHLVHLIEEVIPEVNGQIYWCETVDTMDGDVEVHVRTYDMDGEILIPTLELQTLQGLALIFKLAHGVEVETTNRGKICQYWYR